jgi:hypothetical protein
MMYRWEGTRIFIMAGVGLDPTVSSTLFSEAKSKADNDTLIVDKSTIPIHMNGSGDESAGSIARIVAIVDPLAPSQICIRLLQQPNVRVIRVWSRVPLPHHAVSLQKGHQLHFDADIYHSMTPTTPLITPMAPTVIPPLLNGHDTITPHVTSSTTPSSSPSTITTITPTIDDKDAAIAATTALERTVSALRARGVEYVLAAVETGVELADQLAHALHLRCNGISLSAARRDKFLMQVTTNCYPL